MSDETTGDLGDAGSEELALLLANPAVWAEPSPGVEDRIIAAIAAERAGSPGPGTPAARADGVIDLEERRARRTGRRRFRPLAAAAALVIVAAAAAAGFAAGRVDGTDGIPVAMAPTELAPGASAVAYVDEQPNGARLVVEISGLQPAPAGSFYEVWLVREEPRTVISAGTFHMRGSDSGEIEFWAGVSPRTYPIVTVTLEAEADPSAPGELVLIGEIDAS